MHRLLDLLGHKHHDNLPIWYFGRSNWSACYPATRHPIRVELHRFGGQRRISVVKIYVPRFVLFWDRWHAHAPAFPAHDHD